MIFEHPKRLLAIVITLLTFGFVMPFLMAIRVVESTFFLNFLSFGASVLGLFLGIAWVAAYNVKHKKKDDEENRYR